MLAPGRERAPTVKLRIIFLSSPAREEKRHRERDMRRPRTSIIVTQPDPGRISPRIGANVATEAEQQCKLKSPQWSRSGLVCSILFRKLDLSITEKYQKDFSRLSSVKNLI